VNYRPGPVPQDGQSLRGWLAQQVRQIADALRAPEVTSIHIEPRGAVPVKMADGDIVFADGSNWNPGSGAGVYARISGAWVKL